MFHTTNNIVGLDRRDVSKAYHTTNKDLNGNSKIEKLSVVCMHRTSLTTLNETYQSTQDTNSGDRKQRFIYEAANKDLNEDRYLDISEAYYTANKDLNANSKIEKLLVVCIHRTFLTTLNKTHQSTQDTDSGGRKQRFIYEATNKDSNEDRYLLPHPIEGQVIIISVSYGTKIKVIIIIVFTDLLPQKRGRIDHINTFMIS